MTTRLPEHVIRPALCLAACLAAATACALPEDADQPIRGTYDNSELLLDEGKQVYYGIPGKPAELSQGTLNITGQEITVERAGGEVKRVTVTGTPAHYSQQPSADQAVVTAEGLTIVLDYDSQHLALDGQVRFTQASDQLTGCHIDYYIETRRLTTSPCEDGEQSQFIIAPRNGQ